MADNYFRRSSGGIKPEALAWLAERLGLRLAYLMTGELPKQARSEDPLADAYREGRIAGLRQAMDLIAGAIAGEAVATLPPHEAQAVRVARAPERPAAPPGKKRGIR